MDDTQKLQDRIKELEVEIKALKKCPPKGSEVSYLAKIATMGDEMAVLRKRLKISILKQGIFGALREEMETMIVPVEAPEVIVPKKVAKGAIEEHFVMHLSDEHADEIVLPHQVGGLENYNFEVALCRAENYVESLLDFKTALTSHTFPVLHILSYGDHTSGEIHGGKERSAYRNMFRNSIAIGQMQALMIRDLSAHFRDVYVYCVPGNHGRRTPKKDFHGAHDNFDYLISEIARLHCTNLKNVRWAIPDTFSMNIDINGWGFGLEHGDGVKSWMSIPFYGIERKTRRMTALHNSIGKKISYWVFGHHHMASTMADLKGETIINGAWKATDPYAYEEFSGFREPMQLIHGVHRSRGMTWRLPVKLRDEEREKNGPQRYKVDLVDETKHEP